MDSAAHAWFLGATSAAGDWPPTELLAAKTRTGSRISVVIPARNECSTIGPIVTDIRRTLMRDAPLVDELVVMDSNSDDATAAEALAAGATVWHVADVRPDLGSYPGKGEALWKSLFVTTGDVLVFIDADLTDWGSHFITGLMGPLLADADVCLVKGFYDRLSATTDGATLQGGRVTELVARPIISLHRPQLCAVVQPLAGEWAIRRQVFERLPVPVGYGVEMATLLDIHERHGLAAIAQVDLGRRAHRHQSVHDLGVMAAEIIQVADRRTRPGAVADTASLCQFDRNSDGLWRERPVPLLERPPAVQVKEGAGVPR